MRVVDVNPFFYPLMGGIEHRMHMIAKEMARRGHEVYIVTGRLEGTEAREETPDGYTVVRLPSRFVNVYNPPYISSKGVLEALESLDADIVNFNYRWAPSYTRDLRRYPGRKVFTYHNMWGEGIGIQAALSEANDRLFRRTLDTFDGIIAVSGCVRDDLVRRGCDPERITVALPCLERLPEVRAEEGGFCLSLGRLVRTKGLDYLVEAMRDADCRLVVCGKGPDEARLRRKISRLGLEGRVEMRGWVSEEEKEELMSTCMFFAMPSLHESYGLAAAELMSHGRPVVCTDVDGLPDTVGAGGVLVRPRDPRMLAEAMNRLLSDPGERRRIGREARRIAESRTVQSTVDAVEAAYEAALRARRARISGPTSRRRPS